MRVVQLGFPQFLSTSFFIMTIPISSCIGFAGVPLQPLPNNRVAEIDPRPLAVAMAAARAQPLPQDGATLPRLAVEAVQLPNSQPLPANLAAVAQTIPVVQLPNTKSCMHVAVSNEEETLTGVTKQHSDLAWFFH